MAFGLGKRVLQHGVHTCELLHPSWFCHRCLVFICYNSSLKLCALVTMIMRMITRTKIQSGKVKVLGKGQLTSNTHRLICARESGLEQANWSNTLSSNPVTRRLFRQHTLLLHVPLPCFLSQPSCPGGSCLSSIQTQHPVVLAVLSQIIFFVIGLLCCLLPFLKSLYRSTGKGQLCSRVSRAVAL